jgi:hypothetical protein
MFINFEFQIVNHLTSEVVSAHFIVGQNLVGGCTSQVVDGVSVQPAISLHNISSEVFNYLLIHSSCSRNNFVGAMVLAVRLHGELATGSFTLTSSVRVRHGWSSRTELLVGDSTSGRVISENLGGSHSVRFNLI